MNEKLYIQDLINLIAEKREISKKEAETFLKAFFEVIEQGLDQDKSVKIKGLGTFKLIRVESRESIDVNTGKRCVIEGHTKISFTPDSSVRDFINKPFSHFETVVLNENVFFDETEGENVENSSSDGTIEEEKVINDSVVISEIVEINDSLENRDKKVFLVEPDKEEVVLKIEEESDREDKLLSESRDANPEVEEVKEQEENKEERREVEVLGEEIEEIKGDNLEIEVNEDNNFVSEPSANEELSVESVNASDSSVESLSEKQEIVTKPANKKWVAYTAVTLVSVFIVISIIYFIFNPSIFERISKNTIENTQQVNQNDNIVADTYDEVEEEVDEEDIISEEINLEEEHFLAHNEAELPSKMEPERASPQEILSDTTKTIITGLRQGYDNVKADSTSYRIVGTMTIHTLQSGETLTRVSNRFYGSKDLWPYLVMHNRNIIKNPDNVPSGTTIRIPALRDKE